MLEEILNLSDPSKNSYYFPILLGISIIFLLIQLIIKNYQKKKYPYIDVKESFDNIFKKDKIYPKNIHIEEIKIESEVLSARYLIAFVLIRSAMWSKAPYLYTIFTTVHKFSFAEISILYLVSAVAVLILFPITRQLSDRYSRKLFCHIYNVNTIIYSLSLIQGSRPLVYLAQFCSGFGVGFITTTFEEWVLSESERIFGNLKEEAERFRTNLFVKSNIYDAVVSTITCILCAFIYYYRGIYAPFWISIILSFLAIVYISIFWKENKLQVPKNESTWTQLDEAFKELKKVDVLCIGLIEGLVWASLNIYLFSWTPILKQSTPGEMNVGFIFTAMVLSMIIGTKSYKLIIVYLKLDYYLSITGCLFFQGLFLFLIYYINDFLYRIIFFALFNGMIGFYNPLNSVIKSIILVEKYRALLMNLFRIPLNIYLIVILITFRNKNPLTSVFIAGIMCYIAFCIGLFLVIHLRVDKKKKE